MKLCGIDCKKNRYQEKMEKEKKKEQNDWIIDTKGFVKEREFKKVLEGWVWSG